MSADNGYYVAKVEDKPNAFGIFYYQGESASVNSLNKAKAAYNDPVAAIIYAHEIERESQTEYGVHVTTEVLDSVQYIGLSDSRIK